MGAMNRIARKHANALLILVLFISKTTVDSGSSAHVVEHDKHSNLTMIHDREDNKVGEFQVAGGTTEYRPLQVDHGRKLGPFQVCLVCKCCMTVSDPTTCSNMPCCFGIDCQLPNKPFGVCAFVPKTCNCTSCASA